MKKIILILLLFGLSAPQLFGQVYSLQDLKSLAVKNNKKIREAELQVKASEQVVGDAFTHFFPTVNAQAFAMQASDYLMQMETPEMNLPVYDGNPANLPTATQFAYIPPLSIEALDYMNVGLLTAIQPLYAGGRIRNGYKLAQLGKKINEQALELNTEEVLVTTEVYYWSLLSLQEKQKTLMRHEALLTSLLKDVQVAYQAGMIHKSDVLKVEMELNSLESKKLELNNGIQLTKMALAQHVGLESGVPFEIEDTSFTITPPQELFREPETAVYQRAEVNMLSDAVTAEELKKKMTLGELMPQLAVGLQGQYLDFEDHQYSVGIAFATVSVPLSGWWGGSYKLQKHRIGIDIAQNKLEETTELLRLQIEKAFFEMQESFKQIQVAQASVAQAEEHLNIVTDNYEAGVVSTSDLLEAQALSQQARDELVDAQSIYQIKKIRYLQSVAML